jgi:2-polyprenyl-3-methyl-5-hydroxy-6-metoxy-1,4-benzoquinol methylase
MDYKIIDYCLCCHDKNLKNILDLGEQPLANNFHNLNEDENNYPLKLNLCIKCYHCQLSAIINPDILFLNYKYVSGTSTTGLIFFKYLADYITYYKNIKNGNILDIACNDGSQLNFFKNLCWNTYGVDPAKNLYLISSKNHNIICDYWNFETSNKLPKMDVILAQNVFAHTEYVDDFLLGCKNVLKENGSLFIQTSQKNMILNNEFDTIYHEHISFFNTKSMDILTKRNGLILNKVFENPIHGTSYIFEIKLYKDDKIYNVDEYLHNENINGLYDLNTYDIYKNKVLLSVINLKKKINEYKQNKYKCIGFGASAKSQTVLCYGDIKLDYIIDENPLKINLFSPKLNIPIVDLDFFIKDNEQNYLIILTAWNFSEEIINKIKINKNNKNIIIMKQYFPDIILQNI